MNLILENTDKVPFFTDMQLVFEALGIDCADFDWYISDLDTNAVDFQDVDQWMTGSALKTLISKNEIQFDWAVFSAFDPGTRFEVENPPCADGNADYWNGSDLMPQLKGAHFEIACWDSSATLLIGISEESAKKFCAVYGDARKLEDRAR